MEETFYTAAIKFAWTGIKARFVGFFKKKPLELEEIKKRAQILLVDNEPLESLMSNIRQAGWNVKQLREIENLDSEVLKNADIIFVDYKDVGAILTPTEEGIGLLKVLKRKYTDKHIIFFSGYAGFIPGHEFHDIADGWIQKNADPYIYIERIEEAAREIYDKRR